MNDKKKAESKAVPAAETALAAPANSGASALLAQGKAIAAMTPSQRLKSLEEIMGLDAADVEVVAAGKLPFWPAYAGGIVVGTLESRREVPTRFVTDKNPEGKVGIYTVRVERPCVAATLDGEVFELAPGDCITVLERAVLKELGTRLGQRIGILCVGKAAGKKFEYWDYQILGQKRTPEEIQAGSLRAMAALQEKSA